MAHFIKSFKLCKEYYGIKPFVVEFKPGLNLIVGENGAGKSTLLDLITSHRHSKELRVIDFEPGTNFKLLDTENQNPRQCKSLGYGAGNPRSKMVPYELLSKFKSHGEAMLPLVMAMKDFKDHVIFIDEPESGISLSNQIKLMDAFNKASEKNNCQVILTTHSYVLIKSVEEVFDMSRKAWVTSNSFLKNHLGGLIY